MNRRKRQGGFLLIAAIFLVVVAAALVATMAFITTSSGSSAGDSLQSGQALFVAESGLELDTRTMAQNLDWYRSATDPIGVAAQNVGAGSFTVSAKLPATILRRNISNSAGANVICVYTVDRFPATGQLQLDEDFTSGGEFVQYTGTAASLPGCGNLPAFTGAARGVIIAGIGAAASAHTRGAGVYPVTTLAVANLANSCTAPTSFQIVAHSKFLDAGTLDIEGEEISYSGATTNGANLVLSGVQRCQNGTVSAGHNVGVPVTPMLLDGAVPDYEAAISSTGTVGSSVRVVRKIVQR